jgi:hypothetical protein
MITPFIFVGVATVLIGLYMTVNAAWEFDAGMRLKGVDPDEISTRGRQSGIRRNQIVGAVVTILGFGLIGWGLIG